MRKLTFLLATLAVAAVSARAQEKPRFNPDLSWNTLRAEYGYWTPMDSRMSSGDAFLSLNYTRRYSGHWGWRAGLMYQTENTSVQDGIGLPVAAVDGEEENIKITTATDVLLAEEIIRRREA